VSAESAFAGLRRDRRRRSRGKHAEAVTMQQKNFLPRMNTDKHGSGKVFSQPNDPHLSVRPFWFMKQPFCLVLIRVHPCSSVVQNWGSRRLPLRKVGVAVFVPSVCSCERVFAPFVPFRGESICVHLCPSVAEVGASRSFHHRDAGKSLRWTGRPPKIKRASELVRRPA